MEQIEMLRSLSISELESLRDAMNKVIEERYDEMWWIHDKIDNYLYVVHYADDKKHMSCKGKESYEEFMKHDDAIWIERYTKDLFPTYEFLMRKEQYA